MKALMSTTSTSRVRLLAATALAFAAAAACGQPQRPAPATPATMALPEVATSKVDTSGCDPSGKSIVVIERDAQRRPSRWRYFAPAHVGNHSVRVLTCEAADRNGDGKVDTRYFYDSHARLVLEQRDMDFDGRAEFVVDYSRFPTQGSVVRARDLGNASER